LKKIVTNSALSAQKEQIVHFRGLLDETTLKVSGVSVQVSGDNALTYSHRTSFMKQQITANEGPGHSARPYVVI